MDEDLRRRFVPERGEPTKQDRGDLVASRGWRFAQWITELCPEGRERALAITRLEEAVMWARASIDREEE